MAYTGSPQLNLTLNGTSMHHDGCVNLSQNTDAQTILKQEIKNLNKDLKKLPGLSHRLLGVAYHF